MATFIAFLRGINVGGHKIIKMDELAKMFSSFGCKDVKTFIASGNVIFESPEKNSVTLRKKVESGLEKKLGYRVFVILRTIENISALAKKNPFKKTKVVGVTRMYVTFLEKAPDAKLAKEVMALKSDIEEFFVKGEEMFSIVRKDTAKKPLFSNMMVEKKLGISGTTRDMNTVKKIVALYG